MNGFKTKFLNLYMPIHSLKYIKRRLTAC